MAGLPGTRSVPQNFYGVSGRYEDVGPPDQEGSLPLPQNGRCIPSVRGGNGESGGDDDGDTYDAYEYNEDDGVDHNDHCVDNNVEDNYHHMVTAPAYTTAWCC